MHLYLDESIHNDYGFMLLAYVLCEKNPHKDLTDILRKYGLSEFHACARMKNNALMQSLRNELTSFVNSNCSWGVLILPNNSRSNVHHDIRLMLEGVVRYVCKSPLDIFIDEGIINKTEAQSMFSIEGVNSVEICASQMLIGIQLADLVAALNGVRLREEISNKPKMLIYGEDYGYNPPIEAALSFELWATLRYSMLRQSTPMGNDMPEMAMFPTRGYGLFISPRCNTELAERAEKVFGVVYLGCIH
jgi:hypothetical protein